MEDQHAFRGRHGVVAGLAWSPVRTRDHTTAQIVVGAIIGAAVGGGLYAALI